MLPDLGDEPADIEVPGEAVEACAAGDEDDLASEAFEELIARFDDWFLLEGVVEEKFIRCGLGDEDVGAIEAFGDAGEREGLEAGPIDVFQRAGFEFQCFEAVEDVLGGEGLRELAALMLEGLGIGSLLVQLGQQDDAGEAAI